MTAPLPSAVWIALSPYVVLGVAIVVTLGLDALGRAATGVRLACGAMLVASGLAVWTAVLPEVPLAGEAIMLGGPFGDPAAGGLAAGAVTAAAFVVTFLALLSGVPRLSAEPHGAQVSALVLFSAGACGVLISALDLAVFVVALEILALCGFALVSASRDPRADEAAMKYFVQAAVATGLLVYGVAIVFGVYGGVTGYAGLAAALTAAGLAAPAIAGMTLLVAAIAFKLAAFPFHSWAPDAYETASAPVVAFLASVPKVAALAAGSVLLLGVFGAQQARLIPLAGGLCVASIVFGNLGALRQTSLQRMLGYSGIAQVGYAFVAFTAGGRVQLLIFGVMYAVAAAGAFICAEAASQAGAGDGEIASLAGLGRTRPVIAASLAVCLLSLTGMPLTAGFWGKLAVFSTVIMTGSPYWWLAIVGVLGSVVSFGYYGAVLRTMYLQDGEDAAAALDAEDARVPAPAKETEEPEGDEGTGVRLGPTSRLPAMAAALSAGLVLAFGVAPLFWGRLALFVLSGSSSEGPAVP